LTAAIETLTWPAKRLAEVLQVLATRSGFALHPHAAAPVSRFVTTEDGALAHWVEVVATRLGLEAEAMEASSPKIPRLLRGCALALLKLGTAPEPRFVAVLSGRGRTLSVLTPDLSCQSLPVETLLFALRPNGEAIAAATIDALLHQAGIAGQRRGRARAALLGEMLAGKRIPAGWIIRPAGTAPFTSLACEARLLGPLSTLVGAHTLYFGLWVLSWWLLGQVTLEGHLGPAWLYAWALVLLTALPLRLLASYTGGRLALRAGALLKRQLLFGALRLEPRRSATSASANSWAARWRPSRWSRWPSSVRFWR
jgi:ATP-binding cassette subfamily B protein